MVKYIAGAGMATALAAGPGATLAAECYRVGPHSVTGEQPREITIHNVDPSASLDVYWIDLQGNVRPQASIPAATAIWLSTYEGHIFVAQDVSQNGAFTHVVGKNADIYTR